jgi:hypothetical protein
VSDGAAYPIGTGAIPGPAYAMIVDDNGFIIIGGKNGSNAPYVMFSDDNGYSFSNTETAVVSSLVATGQVIGLAGNSYENFYALISDSSDKLHIARYYTGAWSLIGYVDVPHLSDTTPKIAYNQKDGSVYVGGFFLNIRNSAAGSDIRVNHIAKYNGSVWVPLRNGLDSAVRNIYASKYTGFVHVSGNFTYALGPGESGIPRKGATGATKIYKILEGGVGIWNGYEWMTEDFVPTLTSVAGSVFPAMFFETPNYRYMYSYSDLLVTGGSSLVDVQVGLSKHLSIVIKGPATLSSIRNNTLNRSMYFTGMPITHEEVVTIHIKNGNASMVSSTHQNKKISSYIMPGSDYDIVVNNTKNDIRIYMSQNYHWIILNSNIRSLNPLIGVTDANTDNYRLYVNTVWSDPTLTINFYKDSARTQLVASATATYTGVFPVTDENSSGIHGYISVVTPGTTLSTGIVQFTTNPSIYFKKQYRSIDEALNDRL